MKVKSCVVFIFLLSVVLAHTVFAQLPDPWISQDIGAPETAGSVEEDNGVFTIIASGGIWLPDDFHYVYQLLSGDVEIVGFLDSYTHDVSEWTKVGLMLRNDDGSQAKNVFLFTSPGPVDGTPWGTCMQARLQPDAEPIWMKTFWGEPFPLWQKLTKVGSTVTGYVSTDGEEWSMVETTEIELDDEFMVGMAVAATAGAATVTATFMDVVVTSVETGVEDAPSQTARTFSLADNYPNPFNPSTTIEFSISEQNHVSLNVFDLLGQKVMTLLNEEQNAGRHRVQFDAADLSSGIYVYQLQVGNEIVTKKMTLLK